MIPRQGSPGSSGSTKPVFICSWPWLEEAAPVAAMAGAVRVVVPGAARSRISAKTARMAAVGSATALLSMMNAQFPLGSAHVPPASARRFSSATAVGLTS